ncbi:MAG: efflux transporter outer membrane subunit [Proteobacteria bacterium]|nr:efflux transporter outer membrane subunit [Pseudomonadota bacterium]
MKRGFLRYSTRSAAIGLALLALSGCAGIPGRESRAQLPGAPAAAHSLPDGTGAWPEEGWWRAGDPQLAALIEEGLAHSPDLAVAEARMARAGALARAAGAGLWPSLDGKGGVGLGRQSLNLGYPAQFVAFLPHGWDDQAQVAASLGFDPDLWGRNRSALAAARAEARAAGADARAARLALATAIAGAYADLGGQLAVAELRGAIETNRATMLTLMRQREAAGLENHAGVNNAEALLASARTDRAAADAAVALRRHQLAALLGAGPDRTEALVPAAAAIPAALPAGASTDLLGRRADIAVARARVTAAAARVRVARADFFPSLRLDALVGLQSVGVEKLFQAASTFGSVGPALNLPLFHAGARIAQYRGAQADYAGAVADYNRTVLAAYQQAADAVANHAGLAVQRDASAEGLRAAASALELARGRARAGLASNLEVLSAEERWLQARIAAAALGAAARGADIALIRALGGGFAAPAKSEGTPR